MSKRILAPRKARAQQNCEAWFYVDNPTSVQIFVRPDNGPTYFVEITRRQLAGWFNRARAPTARATPPDVG